MNSNELINYQIGETREVNSRNLDGDYSGKLAIIILFTAPAMYSGRPASMNGWRTTHLFDASTPASTAIAQATEIGESVVREFYRLLAEAEAAGTEHHMAVLKSYSMSRRGRSFSKADFDDLEDC